MDKAKPQPQKNHKRIVDLDALETPESSFYLAVRCFGKVWEPTKVERMVLKLYNVNQVDKNEFLNAVKYVYTRMRRDWNTFFVHVISLEAYGHVFVQTQSVSEICNYYCTLRSAFEDAARHYGADLDLFEKRFFVAPQIQHALGKMKFAIDVHAAFLYAVHRRYKERELPLYLYPLPLRQDFNRLHEEINMWRKMRQEQPLTAEELPPYKWEGFNLERAHGIINPQRNALMQAEQEARNILKNVLDL